MKRRSETGPADFRHPHPDRLPIRRVSAIDATSVNDKLESLRREENSNLRRRTTVTSLCPIFKSNHFKQGENINGNENVCDDEDEDENGKGEMNGDASLIGMDEESLTELVELTQKIDSTL